MSQKAAILRFDLLLALVAITISLVGIVLISSATHNTPRAGLWLKQLMVLGLGVAVMVLISLINYRLFLRFALFIYVFSIAVLLFLLVLGRMHRGVYSWLTIGGFSFQPSEFAKLALILMLARSFAKIEKEHLTLWDLTWPMVITAIPVLLTAAQPDLGTALTMVPLFLGIAVIAGLRIRALVALILVGLILFSFAWMFVLKDYQKERLRSFLNPGDDPKQSGYQIRQSQITIGSGGWFGKGLYLGSQSQLHFVPAQHTDFILSVLGEELGFIGILGVLCLYGMFFIRALYPAREVRDVAGIYVVVGVVSYLAFQTIVNVLMSIGLFPTTGVPLPMLSYGGSSLLSTFIGIGLIASVYAHPYRDEKFQI